MEIYKISIPSERESFGDGMYFDSEQTAELAITALELLVGAGGMIEWSREIVTVHNQEDVEREYLSKLKPTATA